MEDKKTLWIVLGIAVCVLVVAAVGFFWFLPSDQSLASAGNENGPAKSGGAGFDPVEWVRQEDSFPGLEEKEEQAEDFIVISDELVYGIPEKETGSESAATDAEPEGETITLDIPAAAPVKQAPAGEPAAVPVRRAVQTKPAETIEKKAVKVTEYWIQAGSFSTLSKASEVKDKLNENGAASTISTTNINGTDYYRVRLGPYGDQMEADKFLTWVKAVKGFEGSYISEVYVTR